MLACITSPSKQWKTFIAVSEIQELMSVSEWSHVSTKDNSADVISCKREPNQILEE